MKQKIKPHVLSKADIDAQLKKALDATNFYGALTDVLPHADTEQGLKDRHTVARGILGVESTHTTKHTTKKTRKSKVQ